MLLYEVLLQIRPYILETYHVSFSKILWQFNRTFPDKQESSWGSYEKIILQFIKSISLYIGLHVVMKRNLDGTGMLYSKLYIAHNVQLSWFESLFSCHEFGSLLMLGLLSILNEITSELSKYV